VRVGPLKIKEAPAN